MIRPTSVLSRIRRGPGTWLLAWAIVLGLDRLAHASPNYPAILDKHFGVDCPRPLTRCLICHTTAAGGIGTAKQPFAQALLGDYGLSGGKDGRSLADALDRVPADLDSDGDGTPDLDELANCGNPSGGDLSEGPGYGCTFQVREQAHGSDWGLAALVLCPLSAIALLRRAARR